MASGKGSVAMEVQGGERSVSSACCARCGRENSDGHGLGKIQTVIFVVADRLSTWLSFVFRPRGRKQVVACIAFWVFIAAVSVVFALYVTPPIIDEGIIPLMESAEESLATHWIVIISISWMAVMPCIFFPTTPATWLAALTLPLGWAIAVVLAGAYIGFCTSFFFGRWLLRDAIARVVVSRPRMRALLLIIEEVGQWRAICIMRMCLSYIVASYICAVSEGVTFVPYAVASIVVETPFFIVGVFLSRELKSLSQLLQGNSIPTLRLVTICVSASAGLVMLVGGGWYGRRAMKKAVLRVQEEERALEAAHGGGRICAACRCVTADDGLLMIAHAGDGERHANGDAGRAGAGGSQDGGGGQEHESALVAPGSPGRPHSAGREGDEAVV